MMCPTIVADPDIRPPAWCAHLTATERGILGFLLSAPCTGRDQLVQQRESAKAVIDSRMRPPNLVRLSVERDPATYARVAFRVPMMAEAHDTDGMVVHILLHVIDGYMDVLQTYREDPGHLTGLPNPEALQIVEVDGRVIRRPPPGQSPDRGEPPRQSP